MNKSKIIPTIKKWLLMISMSLGIGGYFLILSLNLGQETNHQIATVVTNMLPYLLFVMLFLEFSKIEPRDLFPKKWLWMVFAFQIVMAFVHNGQRPCGTAGLPVCSVLPPQPLPSCHRSWGERQQVPPPMPYYRHSWRLVPSR